MHNKNKKVVTKFWNMSLYLPRLKDRLVALVGENRNINDWFETKVTIIKADTYSQVGLAETETLGKIYVKRYSAKFCWHRLAMLLVLGRPVKCFKMSSALLEHGLPVPEPYGLITAKGFFGFPHSSYYLCQGLIDAEDLKSFYMAADDSHSAIIKDRLQCVGRQLAQLHNAGYMHGDCKWSNILLQGTEVFFVDLDNSRKTFGRDAEAKDLARFILNAEELAIGKVAFECFINAYCETRNNASNTLMSSSKFQLDKLRIKHLARYGDRGERLMG